MAYEDLKPQTVWTCDRCKAQAQVNTGDYPKPWVRVTKHAGYGSGDRTLDMCQECGSDFFKFFMEKK